MQKKKKIFSEFEANTEKKKYCDSAGMYQYVHIQYNDIKSFVCVMQILVKIHWLE